MAHFAELDSNNIVIRVLVTDNNATNEGYDWLIENLGGTWVQTSYNGNFRKRFAGQGFEYDPALDAFIAPKPYPSWILNEATCNWESPTPLPDSDFTHAWNEETLAWEIVDYYRPEA